MHASANKVIKILIEFRETHTRSNTLKAGCSSPSIFLNNIVFVIAHLFQFELDGNHKSTVLRSPLFFYRKIANTSRTLLKIVFTWKEERNREQAHRNFSLVPLARTFRAPELTIHRTKYIFILVVREGIAGGRSQVFARKTLAKR